MGEGFQVFLLFMNLLLIGYSLWMFGGQTDADRSVILLSMLGLFVLIQIGHVSGKRCWHPPPVPSSICLAIAVIGTLQCLELPHATIRFLSAGVSEAWQSWIPRSLIVEATNSGDPALSFAAFNLQSKAPASGSPWLTRLAISTPITFGLAAWISCGMTWSVRSVRGFCAGLAISGCALTFFGLADAITLSRDWHHELRARLWITPIGSDSPFGTFVNSNNAAGFLHVALSAAIASFFLAPKNKANLKGGNYWQKLSLLAIAIIATGILGTQSRGATVALFAAGTIFLMQTRLKSSRYRTALFLFAILIAATSLFESMGTGETFVDRVQSVIDGRASENSRVTHWQDALQAASRYAPMGSGLGTYRYAYLPFDRTASTRWHVNADGMPIEWLVEGGIWLPAFVLFGVLWWFRILRRIKVALSDQEIKLTSDQEQIAFAVWRMMSFLTVTLLITQCFDFGILLPAVYLPVAVLLGLMSHISRTLQENKIGNANDRTNRFYATALYTNGILLAGAAYFSIGASTFLDLRQAAWIKKVETVSSANRRTTFDQWRSFDKELNHLETFVSTWPWRASSEHFMLLSSLRIRQQQYTGWQHLQKMIESNSVEPSEIHPKMLSLAILRQSLKNREMQGFHSGPASLMLPGQQLEQYITARDDAMMSLLHSPLDERPRVRLIETDQFGKQPITSSQALGQQAVQLRRGNKNIAGYLKRMLE